MARTSEAEKLLREGHYPSEIARHMGISVKSVIQYLRTQVGEGTLRLSDLYFSWPPEKRTILQQAGRGAYPDDRLLSDNGLSRNDLDLFQSLRTARVFRGDMYEYVSEAELAIHRLVRTLLEREFGVNESGWWRKGIPQNVRERCATRHQADEEPCEEPYFYTTLIDLSVVVSKNWRFIVEHLPEEYRSDHKRFESDMVRLNSIRNSVMHPVKEKKWSEDDFVFVRHVSKVFGATVAS